MKKLLFLATILVAVTATAQKHYSNPILSGFYPDPSIVRVGEDYYLTNSTFSYFPGLPIFHSKDLVNWKLIGHVITRATQMDFTGKGVSRSLFAPTIRYHKGLFYVTCTMIDGGGNFVVTAKDPAGPWSDPYWLPIDGIDPSLYFDDDGKCYITYNSIPPDNKSLYDGHRTIRMNEFDYKQMKIVSDNKILVNGGTDINKKPSWIEGPHIVKKYGYYYLISAEGGTGADHSVVAFRSKNIWGPYEPYKNNPILTQRHLGERKNPITSTGHADLVELPDGRWYAVFLGTRPYEADYFNTGRETFLTPVEWQNEWPILNPDHELVQYKYPLPLPENRNGAIPKYSSNFSLEETFSGRLSDDWIFLRTVHQPWHRINDGRLEISLRPETIGGKGNPSYLARRQQHTKFTASTAMNFSTTRENEKAGLLCFINEGHYYFLCRSYANGKDVVQLYKSIPQAADTTAMELLATVPLTSIEALTLKVKAAGSTYNFYIQQGKKEQHIKSVDGKFITTKVAGGFGGNFVGVTIGPYATSLGQPSVNTASYEWFEYKGDDDVHKTNK